MMDYLDRARQAGEASTRTTRSSAATTASSGSRRPRTSSPAGTRDDLIQEGLVGLYKAVRDYRTDRESSFRNFAELCITRQIITAVKTATRNKHTPLNQYVSFSSDPGRTPAATASRRSTRCSRARRSTIRPTR